MPSSLRVRPGRWSRRRGLCIGGFVIIIAGAGLAEGSGESSLASRLLRGPGVANHPVGVRPSSLVRIPSNWPLGRDGTLTCLTCHESLPRQDGAADPRLRGVVPGEFAARDFCARCHTVDAERSSAGLHWLAVGRAHVRASAATSGALLDAESRRCMSCHDGVSARESANSTPYRRGSMRVSDPRRNHPVGVEYPKVSGVGSASGLRPMSVLPGNLRLPEGKVGCVSCHDLYAADRYHLAMPIEESRLCLACHDL